MPNNPGNISPATSQKSAKENSFFRAISFRKKKNKSDKDDGYNDQFPEPLVKRKEVKLSQKYSTDVTDAAFQSGVGEHSPVKQYRNTPEGKPPLPPKNFSKSQLKIDAVSSDNIDDARNDTNDSDKHPEINFGESANSTSTPVPSIKSNVSSRPGIMSKIMSSQEKNRKQSLTSCRTEKEASPVTVKYVRVHGIKDGAYKNDSEPRGMIFMKNFESFADDRYPFRSGASHDYFNLLDLFQQMGYKKHSGCCESGYITKEKFLKDLKSFSKLEHKLYDSTIIIIMSHGVRDKTFITSDNEEVDLMDVYSMFNNSNCKGLRNKPKIFILQFCRPSSELRPSFSQSCLASPTFSMNLEDVIDHRVKLQVDVLGRQLRQEFQRMVSSLKHNDLGKSDADEENSSTPVEGSEENLLLPPSFQLSVTADSDVDAASYISTSRRSSTAFSYQDAHLLGVDGRAISIVGAEPVPDYSDMYSIFATNSGGLAYRNPRKGSLLIQAICHVFSNHAYQDDIEELVRKVSKHMQQELSKDDPLSRLPQAVVERVNNGLDKAFYFNPFPAKERKRSTTLKW